MTITMAATAVLLAGCGDRTATSQNDATTASMTQDNAVDAMAQDNVAAADNATAANLAGAAAPRIVAYDCKPAMALAVRYDNDATPDGQAMVTLDGKDYTLDHVMSGSGARYLTKNGRAPGTSLVWWNKGRGGMLLEGKADDPAADEKPLANCAERG